LRRNNLLVARLHHAGRLLASVNASEACMRITSAGILVLVATAAVALPTAGYAEGAWCAKYHGGSSGSRCEAQTVEQCMRDINGVGGFCEPNTAAGRRNSSG
jgi:hypothetical protein